MNNKLHRVVDPIPKDIPEEPISEPALRSYGFRDAKENAGNLPCFKIDIITHTTRTMTLARWGKDNWQVWIDTYDLCRITTLSQLHSLIHGLNAKKSS